MSVAEQRRLTESYRAELCSVMKTRSGCDVKLSPHLLNVPVVPCNFIPVDAQLYSGTNDTRKTVRDGDEVRPTTLLIGSHITAFHSVARYTRGSAMAEGPRDALVSRNSVTTKHPI